MYISGYKTKSSKKACIYKNNECYLNKQRLPLRQHRRVTCGNDVSRDGAAQTKRHLSAQGDLDLCVICHFVVCVCVCVYRYNLRCLIDKNIGGFSTRKPWLRSANTRTLVRVFRKTCRRGYFFLYIYCWWGKELSVTGQVRVGKQLI